MIQFKNYLYVIAFVLLGAIAVNFSGCASAESTTGKLAFRNADYAKAEQELTKGLQIDKNDAEGWYMLGYSQVELGKYDAATESFKRSLAINNNFANDILNFWIQKFNGGITAFNTGLNNLRSADSLNATRNFNNALTNFRASASIIPDSVSSFQMMADSYFYLDQNDSALMIYSGILNRTASEADAIQIARILYETGIKSRQAEKYDEAESIFEKVLTIPFLPNNNEFYEVAAYNIAYANYMKATSLIQENPDGDFRPFMNKIVSTLEPVAESSTNDELLKDIYDMLIVAYDSLGMTDKKEAAETKRAALN